MKDLIKAISFSLLLIFLACGDYKSDVISNPPNILFIMADDHAFQAISAYGSPLSKLAPTPNIDRIAENGAIIENGFCTNSICGPSRAVILTGKFSHINGFRRNGEVFDGSQPTWPKYMQQLGYQTAIVGKWHLHGYPQGFDYWKILEGQGNYYNPDFVESSGNSEISKYPNEAFKSERVEGYATDLITEFSLDWLKEEVNGKKPFFLMVHHKAPHRNWMPAIRHLNLYDDLKFPLPDTYFAEHEGQLAAKSQLQTVYKDMYEGHDLKMTQELGSYELAHNPWKSDFDRMTLEQREAWDHAYQSKNDDFHTSELMESEVNQWKGQRYLQDYLSTVAAVDESVGQLLDYLEDNDLLENTIVVYTSDQGFYLGEHGWFDKRFMYEESLRTPILVQYPARIKPGIKVKSLIQNLDFAQTFLDYAGGEHFTVDMQGQSFRKLLDYPDDQHSYRDYIYYHYYDYPAFHMVKKHYGIRGKRYKLMHFYDDIDSWEFYDLKEDPSEITNLIESPEHREIIQQLKEYLRQLQKEYGVTDSEFEKASEDEITKAYQNFRRLRGRD